MSSGGGLFLFDTATGDIASIHTDGTDSVEGDVLIVARPDNNAVYVLSSRNDLLACVIGE